MQDFIAKGIQTYACNEVWQKQPISKGYERYKNIIDGSQFNVGTFKIKPFKVPHTNSDGMPCENYGFLIYSTVTKEKMLWITDCGYISNKFPACDYICVECNYIDVEDYSKEIEYLNKITEKRRFFSHLSQNNCIKFLKMQDLSKIKFVKLLHLTKSQGIIEDSIRDRFAKEFPNMEVQI